MSIANLPPLSALRAFALFAQTRSVAEAGAAINVSHAAISQQLRKLEAHLGVSLLDRRGRQMQLTAEGLQLAAALDEGFGRIAGAVDALTGRDAARPLHISCTPNFAANWLMPRLGGFRATAPEVELLINPSPALSDPAPGGPDIALRYGKGPWPKLENEWLMAAPLVVVGAPELFANGVPQSKKELLTYHWLQELGNNEASNWQIQLGLSGTPRTGVTRLPGDLMVDAARSGQGLALTTRIAVEDDLATGRLLLLYEGADTNGYHIVTAPGVMRPPLKAFVTWLRRMARE